MRSDPLSWVHPAEVVWVLLSGISDKPQTSDVGWEGGTSTSILSESPASHHDCLRAQGCTAIEGVREITEGRSKFLPGITKRPSAQSPEHEPG